MPVKIDHSAFEELAKQLYDPPPPPPPPKKKARGKGEEDWAPDLGPAQQQTFDSRARYILAHGEKGSGKCTSPESQVYTDDGLIRLRQLAKMTAANPGFNTLEKTVVAWDGEKTVPGITSDVWIETSRDARRAILAHGGEVIGSPAHPIWVCKDAAGKTEFTWIKMDEMRDGLTKGERYWTPLMDHPSFTKEEIQTSFGITITEGFAYALGALVGDGSLNCNTGDCRAMSFTNIDPICIDLVARGLAETGAELRSVPNSQSFNICTARTLRAFLVHNGLATLSYHKRIPDCIIESPKPILVSFLRGLFDTDGTVDKAGSVSLTTTSELLALDVQWSLQSMGLLSVRRPRKSASGNPTWNINLFGKWARKYGAEIGFSIPRKQARIQAARTSTLCPRGDNGNRYGLPLPVCRELRAVWSTFLQTGERSRLWHNTHRKFASAFKGCVPSAGKVREMLAIAGQPESRVAQYLISENWVEVTGIEECKSELIDLSVPCLESFLANGVIHHNTVGLLHKLVRHAYENNNALCMIVVRVKAMATKGGAWDKLTQHILPRWKKGLGLEYTDVKFDTNHNEYLFVENRFGGWSMVVLISALHEHQLRERIRGFEPSFVFVDELTSTDGIEYLRAIGAQIGRREGVVGLQQYTAACNPEGPSHWVYKAWWEEPYNPVTGEWDPDYAKFHIPIEENKANLPAGYIEGLVKLYRSDPIEAARMLRGEWIDRQGEEAILKDIFIQTEHVLPRAPERGRIMPNPKYPVIIGLDPGSANNAFSLMQHLPVDDHFKWVYFDEVVYTRRRLRYDVLFPVVLRRVAFWQLLMATKLRVAWNSDTSAFNQFRAAGGSYDVLEFEKIANLTTDKDPVPLFQKLGLHRVKVTPSPKFQGSVQQRTRIVMDLLAQNRIVISAGCPRTIECFNKIEPEAQNPKQAFDPDRALTPKRSDYLHIWSAATYPLLTDSLRPQDLVPKFTGESTQSMGPITAR